MLERLKIVKWKCKDMLYIVAYGCYSLRMTERKTDSKPEHPGQILRRMLDAKGWTQEEAALITGSSRQTIYYILSGKSNVSPEMAVAFSAAFGNTPEEWLKWDSLYRLSVADRDVSEVGKLARIYEAGPIKDMQKRGWIETTADPSELERSVKAFFGSDLKDEFGFPIAPRRTIKAAKLNPAERAWCFRARQLAESIAVAPFSAKRLERVEKRLRECAAYPKEARHIPKLFAEGGIRFVVVEPIPNVKIDGATFWLADDSPVIAMSIRHDRIDGFWFTLMHEFAHVCHGDAAIDPEMIDGLKGVIAKAEDDEAERKANERASASLIPPDELKSFVRRVGPSYERKRIIQFAHKVKIHPGIIVGQLQHKNELGYGTLREMLVKVRDIVTSTALTDGWNQTISPAVL
jgi:HTH-type transcriptional regulator/antitoxin HigA